MIHIIKTTHPWGKELAAACRRRGVPFTKHEHPTPNMEGFVFFQIDQYPPQFRQLQQRAAAEVARPGQHWIQDAAQIQCYEDKVLQAAKFGKWMPETHVFLDYDSAHSFADQCRYPLISKSREGASSYNVRILADRGEAMCEIGKVFSKEGLPIQTEPGAQKDYWLVQEFIPHDITYRVTCVGGFVHVYKRFCYPDKAVAAPARIVPTRPVDYYCPEMQDLRLWAHEVFKDIGTKFCAVDVLRDTKREKWVLLETSLGWARGNDASANSTFYGSKWTLNTQWDLLLDEIENGVFGDK